jgi:hypothetical protein
VVHKRTLILGPSGVGKTLIANIANPSPWIDGDTLIPRSATTPPEGGGRWWDREDRATIIMAWERAIRTAVVDRGCSVAVSCLAIAQAVFYRRVIIMVPGKRAIETALQGGNHHLAKRIGIEAALSVVSQQMECNYWFAQSAKAAGANVITINGVFRSTEGPFVLIEQEEKEIAGHDLHG